MRKTLVAVMAVSGLLGTSLALVPGAVAHGDEQCMPVAGQLREHQVEGPGFQAEGRLTGALQGTDHFTLLSLTETHPETPSVSHFVGHSLIETSAGDIDTVVSGAFDTSTGKFSDLFTIVGGTGEWAGATGQWHLYGTFDFASGTGVSDYRGEVCRG